MLPFSMLKKNDVPTTMLPFTMNDVPVYDVNVFPHNYVLQIFQILNYF